MHAMNADDTPQGAKPADRPSRARRLLVLGGAAAGVAAIWNAPGIIRGLLPQRFAFTPVADPPGFRRLEGGAASGGLDPLAGIGAGRGGGAAPDPFAPSPEALRADLCAALFQGAQAGGAVPVASFSDYRCPYCRVLTGILARVEAEAGGAVRVAWREWPLLGPASLVAAKAALAAKRQGAYPAFHAGLMRGGLIPNPAYLRALAGRIGIDAERMLADMESAAIAREIAETRALADLLGFFGTPSLVVGRTLFSGAIDEPRLRALIAREAEDGPVPACA